MKATFSVEQLHVGDKDFATTITSVSLPLSRKQASFSKKPWRDLYPCKFYCGNHVRDFTLSKDYGRF